MMARPQQWSLLDKKEGELSQGAHPFLFLSADGESLDVKISGSCDFFGADGALLER